MPVWNGKEFNTVEEGKEWWKTTNQQDMNHIMGISRAKRITWLGVATEIVRPGSSVLDVGCGEGLMVETLPEDVSYLGIDLNENYIEKAKKTYSERPNTEFKVIDLYEVLDSDMSFDYTICTSLFGVFPEAETYEIMKRLWDKTNVAMSITTLNKDLYRPRKSSVHNLTSHDPNEMMRFLARLPGVYSGDVRTDIPLDRRTIRRAMHAYATKQRVVKGDENNGFVSW